MEAAQLLGIARWFRMVSEAKAFRVESSGMRSQVVSLVASALEPELFSGIFVRNGIASLRYVLDTPVAYIDAPDLFCFGLYRRFDVDRLAMLSAPVRNVGR